MASKEREFFNACAVGDLARVRSLSTQVDVNWGNPDWADRTGLQFACQRGNPKVVRYLLALPRIDVNKGDSCGCTPLSLACRRNGRENIVKMLAEDRRVDINREDHEGATPLWGACRDGHGDAVKILLASGRKIDTKRKTNESRYLFENITAAELSRKLGHRQLAELIEEHERTPREVAQRLRKELDWTTPASTVFAQMIFLSDGLLRLSDEPSPAKRFFCIADRLPLDLQHLLANRSQGFPADHVPAADRELAFTSLARSLQN